MVWGPKVRPLAATLFVAPATSPPGVCGPPNPWERKRIPEHPLRTLCMSSKGPNFDLKRDGYSQPPPLITRSPLNPFPKALTPLPASSSLHIVHFRAYASKPQDRALGPNVSSSYQYFMAACDTSRGEFKNTGFLTLFIFKVKPCMLA